MKIVLSNKSSVIERSSEFDYRSFGNRTFDCVRLAKFYCEFDYVRLSSAIERLVFDWVRLPNCSIRYPGIRSPMGPKKLTVLPGQGQIMTKYIAFALPEQLVLFNKQWECQDVRTLYKILELIMLASRFTVFPLSCL